MFSILSCRNANLLPYKQPKAFLRSIGLFEKAYPKSSKLTKTHHRIIYEFPYIKLLGPFIRTHRSLPTLAVMATPFLYFFDSSKASLIITLMSAGTYLLFGIALSKVTKNIVGKLYVNKEGDIKEVMISSIDSTGKRIDKMYNAEDVTNSDFPSKPAKTLGFVRLVIENSDEYYLLNVYNCKFIDEKACDCILVSDWRTYDRRETENEVKDNKKQLEG